MKQQTIVIYGTSTEYAFKAIDELNFKIKSCQDDGWKTLGEAQMIYDKTCYTCFITVVKE